MKQTPSVEKKPRCPLQPLASPRRTFGAWFWGGVVALVFGGCGGLGGSPYPPGHRASTLPYQHKGSTIPPGHVASSTPPGHQNTDGSPYNPSRYGRSGGRENPEATGLVYHSCTCAILPSDVFVRPTVAYVICAHDPFDADGLLAGCTPATNPTASQKIPPGRYCGSCVCNSFPAVCSRRGQIVF